MKKKIHKVYIIVTLIVAILVIRNLYSSNNSTKKKEDKTYTYGLTHLKQLFPNADSASIKINGISTVYSKKNKIGIALNSSPHSNNFIGYAGKVPFIIGIDNDNKIVGIVLLENYETYGYIRRIAKKGFFEQWNGLSFSEAVNHQVDVIGGATLTTRAVIMGMQKRLAIYAEEEIKGRKTDWLAIAKYASAFLLILLSLFSFFNQKKFNRYRNLLLIASILVLGFWQGSFLSIQGFYNWIVLGIKLPAQLVLASICLLSILLPLFTNKSYYCQHLCPYGAAQELCGKIVKKKPRIPKVVSKSLRYGKEILLMSIIALLIFEVKFDLTETEPFSAFQYKMASNWVISLAVFFLLISIFIPKAWCNYFCPSGYILEKIRMPYKDSNPKWKRILFFIFPFILLILIVVLKFI